MQALQRCKPPNYVLPDGLDAHGVGGLLKQWLRDLPEPILLDYEKAIPAPPAGTNLADFDKGLWEGTTAHFKTVLDALPASNRALLLELSRFLLDMTRPDIVSKTKMGLDNMCTVFSQCIMRNPSL